VTVDSVVLRHALLVRRWTARGPRSASNDPQRVFDTQLVEHELVLTKLAPLFQIPP
jgi:hypothetical protein